MNPRQRSDFSGLEFTALNAGNSAMQPYQCWGKRIGTRALITINGPNEEARFKTIQEKEKTASFLPSITPEGGEQNNTIHCSAKIDIAPCTGLN